MAYIWRSIKRASTKGSSYITNRSGRRGNNSNSRRSSSSISNCICSSCNEKGSYKNICFECRQNKTQQSNNNNNNNNVRSAQNYCNNYSSGSCFNSNTSPLRFIFTSNFIRFITNTITNHIFWSPLSSHSTTAASAASSINTNTNTNTTITTLTTTINTKSTSILNCNKNFSTIALKWCFILWHFLSILASGWSLSMTEVRIPKHIMRYEDAVLGCKYDLDGESLYSVKWYKDGFEFYRYVPRDMPPGQVFPLPGVDVDLQNSTDNVVVLHRVTLQSTGRYRCEVSGEAPSFQTVSGHEDMIVVVTPTKGPQITGGQPRYQIGDMVRVNCTSAPSKPICHLSWLINGIHANRSFLRYYEPKLVGREGLEVATLGLEFRVRG
ncbi:beaten path IIIb [Glossina fuscipes fuscipes]